MTEENNGNDDNETEKDETEPNEETKKNAIETDETDTTKEEAEEATAPPILKEYLFIEEVLYLQERGLLTILSSSSSSTELSFQPNFDCNPIIECLKYFFPCFLISKSMATNL